MPFFEILKKNSGSKARLGRITTAHGSIETPEFMPVGTQATVKSLDVGDLKKLGAQIILGNTYHLHLRPGEDILAEIGGLHTFMNWHKPILTDSGGYQVFSLGREMQKDESAEVLFHGKLCTIDEEGVTFRSHIDGSIHRFTPEIATNIQQKLGADIIMAFDECTPDAASYVYAKEALERTHRWARQSIEYHQKNKQQTKQYLFGIIQGAQFEDLRKESARVISEINFDGIAIGGGSIGYNREATKQILEWVGNSIPEEKPHYTMGVGFSPIDIFEVVERGIDMFDCVAPTRIARNGSLYVPAAGPDKKFRMNILNAQFKKDENPIDTECACFTCTHHSRAYIHHLFQAQELLAYRLATIHNLHFFLELMRQIRNSIAEGTFQELKRKWISS